LGVRREKFPVLSSQLAVQPKYFFKTEGDFLISAAETRRAVEKKVPDSETCGVSGPLRQISQLPHPRRGNRPTNIFGEGVRTFYDLRLLQEQSADIRQLPEGLCRLC
jgi:hypothetical protein